MATDMAVLGLVQVWQYAGGIQSRQEDRSRGKGYIIRQVYLLYIYIHMHFY